MTGFALKDILIRGINNCASDVHLSVGDVPMLRIDGNLVRIPEAQPLAEDDMRQAVSELLTESQIERFNKEREYDFSFGLDMGVKEQRFRANFSYEKGCPALALRAITSNIRTMKQLGLPDDLKVMTKKNNGLFLVTGPTGSGKSTTLAAIIQEINLTRSVHIVTVEDPIEYLYTSEVALIHQRELGRDTKTFAEALRRGWSAERLYDATRIDPWFLARLHDMIAVQEAVRGLRVEDIDADAMRLLKQYGTSDAQIALLTGSDERFVRAYRKGLGVVPSMKTVDTCAAEFESATEYHYKTYENLMRPAPAARRGVAADEVRSCEKPKVMILGAGPNRIGQGIEFDYCCVHACYELAERGFETIMVNCNPETVSTDYDTSDRLYFEPVTYEDVMDIVDAERPVGVITTLGGQTPVNLTRALAESGVKIMGTQPDAIDFAEDRERFSALLDRLGIMYPPAGMATSFEEAEAVAAQIGYPLLVRPSYVLGGRGMMIAYDAERLREYMAEATRVSPDHPIYLDRFLEGAYESDVDALCDGENVYIGGILEHIEEAGIHSGDSATCIPPFSFSESLQEKLRETTRRIALALGVRGLVNVQYAVKGDAIYVIEANPRASRTVPFISKATGVPLARCAARVMAGAALSDLDLPDDRRKLDYFCMKEAVMPWGRFPGAEVILGPEMKSTGEVMGIAKSYPEAYAKTQLAIDYQLPTPKDGRVFISVCDRDKRHILSLARILRYLGFEIVSTEGTARVLRGGNVPCEIVGKVGASSSEDGGSSILDLIAGGEIAFIVNIPYGPGSRGDGYVLRTEAVRRGVTCLTALSAANAYIAALEARQSGDGMEVVALQDLA